MLMGSHQTDRSSAHFEHLRPANQRDVVEVHDVGISCIEFACKLRGFEDRAPGRLRRNRRQDPKWAPKTMDLEARWRNVGPERVVAPDRVEGIGTMKDVDFVPFA
jgi:hypothetical protein